jgi:hypothetical protein
LAESRSHTHGCPKCGADVLRRAPLPVIGVLIGPFTNKHRYGCRECGWTGWKRRLQRRSSQSITPKRRDGIEPRAAWFFIAVVFFLIVVTILLLRAWITSQPIDVPVGGPGTPA